MIGCIESYPMLKILAYQCQMVKNSLNLDKMERMLKVESMPWLKRYFNNSWSLTKLTMPDLKNVLDGIQSVMFGLSLPKTNAVKSFFFAE